MQVYLSLIIPVLNEAPNLAITIKSAQASFLNAIEIIVVDGGSQDETCAIAESLGACVIRSPAGRAQQMNAGAAQAHGEVLLFVHGDTRLPQHYDFWIIQVLKRSIAGAYELQIDGPQWGLRWVEWGVKWRSRLLSLPYGDQGLFLKRSTFERLGGFPDVPIMEDFIFVQRLRRLGKVAIVGTPVITSARRWQQIGVVRTTLLNQLVIIGFQLGIAPDRLRIWYRAGLKQLNR